VNRIIKIHSKYVVFYIWISRWLKGCEYPSLFGKLWWQTLG